MRPPKGFEDEKYPLRHRLTHSFGLSLGADTVNTALIPLVMHSRDIVTLPSAVKVNPHNSDFVQDTGPLVHNMSIIDRLRISIKFSMTENCEVGHMDSGTFGANGQTAGTFAGDDVPAFNFLWRPIFNVYPEKMDAADDDTTLTVAAILGVTKDATNEDIVPITTNNLPTSNTDLDLPLSNVYDVQTVSDYNMTSDLKMEDHVHDEDVLQEALRHYTNKGALRSCLGRTRHVTLTRAHPFKNFFIDKFVPNAIRRIQSYGWFAIQIHVPIDTHASQYFFGSSSSDLAHLGVKMITNYHEWNFEHNQDRGTPT